MKGTLSVILYFAFSLLILTSCVLDPDVKNATEESNTTSPMVSLRISPVATRSGSSTVTERLGTLRIIMIDKDERGVSRIEFNKLLSFNGSLNEEGTLFTGEGELAYNFQYLFNMPTVNGEKSFYLIANESSAGEISFKNSDGRLSEATLQYKSLTSLLDSYVSEVKVGNQQPESPNTARGEEFETVINSVYFSPVYENDESGNIFLLYSSVYKNISIKGVPSSIEGKLDADMYLVPVATKFFFNFTNYRKKSVQVEDIKLSQINSQNYLLPQLEEGEQTKQLYEEDVYWIDWLAELAKASQNASNPDLLNSLWGWIDGYFLPFEDSKSEISLNSNKKEFIIESRINSYTPSQNSFGPFYVPESRNVVTKNVFNPDIGNYEQKTEQTYYLSFYMHDLEIETITSFEGNEIENLKSLFRATSIVINVTLYDENMDIYAQIAPWNPETFKGYLEETEDED